MQQTPLPHPPDKEGPFLPRINDGGILGRSGERGQDQQLPSLSHPVKIANGMLLVFELQGEGVFQHEFVEYGERDEWLTVPDAVRLTGWSGSMPYRRIKSGALPVRGDSTTMLPLLVGIPPSTMQVRLSDVLRLRPPISADLVKSPAIRVLNLPKIPTEMARLSGEQQKVMQDSHHMQEAYGELKVLVDETVTQLYQEIQTQKETLGSQIQELQKVLTLRIEKAEQQLSLFLEETTSRLQQLADRNDQTDREMERTIGEVRQSISQAQKNLQTAFREELAALKLEIKLQRAQQEHDFLQRTQSQADALAREVDERTKRIEGFHAVFDQERRNRHKREKWLTDRITKTSYLSVGVLQTQVSQARGIQELTTQLQAEQQARHALEKRGTEQDALLNQVLVQLEEEKQARLRLSRQLQVLVQGSNASHLAGPAQENPSRERKEPE